MLAFNKESSVLLNDNLFLHDFFSIYLICLGHKKKIRTVSSESANIKRTARLTDTLSSGKRISSNAITRIGPWRVGTVRVERTDGGVQTLVYVGCTSRSFPARLTSTTTIHFVTRQSILCIAATVRFAVEAVFTRVTV